MSDRSKFIINTSVEFFDAVSIKDDSNAAIKDFFATDEITVLAATHSDGKIHFQHRIPSDEVCLLFYKIPHVGPSTTASTAASSGGGSQPIGLLTLEGGLVKSIYSSVARVYSPHADARQTQHEYGPDLSDLLQNLHVSLGSSLGLPPTGINTIKDEICYWNQKLQKSTTKVDREQALRFGEILETINKQIKKIEHNSLSTVEEFLDNAHSNLDELWRLPYQYPQSRMADLMDVLCNTIIDICADNLNSEDIWNLRSYHITNLMSQTVDVVDSWMQLCDSLTRLFWPNYAQHRWMDKPHIPQRAQLFKDRLAEIRNIKNLYKQIATLIDEDDLRSLLSFKSPFHSTNIFDTSSIGQSKWNKSLQNFEQLLQPIDEQIALALKAQIHTFLSNPRQIIFIFSKYENLIQRPTVLELLTVEREQFIQSMHILLQDLRKAMNDTNMEPDTGHLSVICNECRWLKVVEYQISEIEKVCHLISGRDGSEKVVQTVHELKEETESLLRTNFEIWCGQHLSAVKNEDLRLRDDQPVVKFEKEGRQLMRVTFNPKLVTFCQDVREFENLGYNVPIELRSTATHASKFMSYARRLQQIATFHNTIGDRMIPCQRPIMLKNAVELSKLVQSETVAWNDEESVQRYVSTLQEAVGKLSADNTLLVGYHEQAKRTVMKLMNTDLFNQGQVWKDEMRHLRDLVATLESQGFTNLDAFKLHWDHQLYKVLEYQYVSGLVDMNSKLPDIHIDIVFRQRQLCFRPPEEEIRDKYFTQQRRFIERPLGFRGLSEKSTDLFKSMVERNRNHFGPLFEKAEGLFAKLAEFKKLWLPWIALGCVDIEQLCSVHLVKWEDWDRNFKYCKQFSQQVARIQNCEESIDCFVINILPLRSDIEVISRRYWESLTSSLRSSILNDIDYIQEFLQTSLQFLQDVPMDESSISESGMKYEKIKTELPKVAETLELVKGKDTCLAGWCKERVSALAGILNQWEKLQPLIENHAVILERQIDIMKDHTKAQLSNLRNEAEKFLLRWESTIAELEANEDASLDVFKERQENWATVREQKVKLMEDCEKFNIEVPKEFLDTFDKSEEKIRSQSMQWQILDEFMTGLDEIAQEEWAIYRKRPYVLTEFLAKWEGSLHSSIDLSSNRIRQTVERYETALPILQQLQSDSLTERHWAKILQLLKQEPKPMHSIILKDILFNLTALSQSAAEIQALIRQAGSEQIVRQALTELDQWAVTATLKLTHHSDSAGSYVSLIKDYQEVLNKIGDNQSLLQSAKNSAAYEAFSDQAELWESRLNSLDSVLASLNQSQRRWVYLEPVFGAGTLKNEEALFKRIDKDFRYVMREIANDSRVMSMLKINNISTIVKSLESQLTRCQNNLMSYIMEKRNSFPRFYFLGDDDLLEILGQATKEEIIQKHIKKLFPGCHSLGIVPKDNVNVITSVHSAEGDVVVLKTAVAVKGPIENWLNELVTSIQATLKEQISMCVSQAENLTMEVIQKFPSQVLCTARAIQFTKQTEKAITSMSLQKVRKSLNEEIAIFVSAKNQSTDTLVQIKIRSILMDLVYYVTIVELLDKEHVTAHSDWHWLEQIKFYLDKDSNVIIRMVFAEFQYSYEFLGNPNKLVNTSLTQKCYLILTQAMHMGLGGNPFGPAGTGKTECVKALGSMMGRLVLVFNCDENVDTAAMGLILTGLARCGAWGCFDEFNRLQEATLSAISMLIQPIQTALKDKTDSVTIMDKTVQINHHCGIFVTLNPAGAEYGGRQKLPGNLQALFRPIVMQQPEPREISRVLLFVEGFENAYEIGDRVVELFDLCGKMLSSQKHYDWGLRELKTILLACGRELQSVKGAANEMDLVVKALRLNTTSKLTTEDNKRFCMLIKNVFPEVLTDLEQKSPIADALENAFRTLGLHQNNRQVEKALQLHEQLTKRMGVVVVGPSGCGKTTIMNLLRTALQTSATIKTYTISPKALSREQLLGKLDPDTRQWTDGVLTSTAVSVNAEPATVVSWIICDGDIDPEWIEALNSVLDDNKLLTLPSGWRIQFGNNVNFIFETHSVTHASPATISRMGIVNMSAEDLPSNILIESSLLSEEYGDLLHGYIEEFLPKAMDWIEKNHLISQNIISRNGIAKSILRNVGGVQSKDEFCVRLVKSLMGFIPTDRHAELANLVYSQANIFIPKPDQADLAFYDASRDSVDIYHSDNIFDEGDNSELQLIKIAQVKSYLDALHCLLAGGAPFLIVGPSGSGKTLLVQNAAEECPGNQLVVINCSTQLTPAYVLHVLKQSCVTVSGNRGREYKPQQSKVVLFFKNIDLCSIDVWGTSEIVELLLQIIQRGGFYAANLDWIGVSGVQIAGSISDSPTRFNRISPRFLSINSYLRVKYPTDSDMDIIVQHRLEPTLNQFKNSPNIDSVVRSIMDLFNEVQSTFIPHQGCSHYNFTPKIIMKLVDNLKTYPEEFFNEALMCELSSIFRDRLKTKPEETQFNDILQNTMRRFLSSGKEKIFFVPKSGNNSTLTNLNQEEWTEQIHKLVAVCNTENYLVDEPIITEMLDQTAKISRCLARPKAHLVFLAQPGSRLVDSLYVASTLLQPSKVISLQGVSKYSVADFYNDLKMAMQTAALEDQSTCLLIEHCWITYLPELLKPIEAILEGSEILDLFGDDLESVASSLKHAAQLEGYQESIGSYFMKRATRNLHLVITLDPSNSQADELFQKYPVLYRKCEIICSRDLSEDTLATLPKKFIEHLAEKKEKIPICSFFLDIAKIVGCDYSFKRYYQLIKSYFHLYSFYQQDIDKRLSKLQMGVDKLASAHKVVATLKSNAVQQEVALAEKRKLANEALEMISSTMRNATDQKSSMLELKKKTQESSEKLKERQKAIAVELSEVEPILKEASAAVGQIKSEALSEIRSLRAPPEAIRDILEGVLRLMGIRDTSWNSMKTFLAKRGVKEDIRSLDPARISPENCDAVEKLLNAKSDSFLQKNAKRASAAAAPLATWVIASVKYSKVIQSIKPLEREQAQLQRNLDIAEGEMKSLMSGLDDVDERVKELSKQLNMYTQEAAVLELKLEEASNTLKSSEVLVEKLSAEFQNWNLQLQEYRDAYKTLDVKALMISVAINYFSGLAYDQRRTALDKLGSDLQLQPFDITKSLLSEQEQIIWESMGLARDAQVIENASIVSKIIEMPFGGCPIPLLIDPSETAFNWLREYLESKKQSFDVISQNNDRLSYTLELAVRFGKILIVQDCQDLRPPLMQLMSAKVFVKFNKRLLEVGNKTIDLHENFKIVLISKTDKLNLKNETKSYLTCIPFTVTSVGLTDQLMSKTINLKKPHLEKKRIDLLRNEGQLLKQGIELEDKLLEELSQAQGDILKNEKLLSTLNEVKASSSHIDASLKESKLVRESLMEEYKQFKGLCKETAGFYMGLVKMYEVSPVVFVDLFLKSLEANISDLEEKSVYDHLIRSTFQYLARSTPKEAHLTLGMFVCKCAFPNRVAAAEWELFVTNFMISSDMADSFQCPTWVEMEIRSKVTALIANCPRMQRVLQLEKEHVWSEFAVEKSTDKIPIDLSHFQKVLITQIFRPDLIYSTMRAMVTAQLGLNISAITQPSMDQLTTEGSSSKPILVITEPENDPSGEIRNLAAKRLGSDRYTEMSIGKGMEKEALDCVRKAAQAGKWVCIRNAHLTPNWLVDLDRELDNMKKSDEFRLWIICESTCGFSEAVVYKFVKVLFESPNGLKNKIRRLIQQYSGTSLMQTKDAKVVKMRVAIFILNSVLQERRQYIPQGWTRLYEFGESDLRAALEILKWLDSSLGSSRMDWKVAQRLCGNVAYGGRVNNKRDVDVLDIYLKQFCSSDTLSNRWTPLNWKLPLANTANLQEFSNAVQKLPDTDNPETFGLSAISNLARDLTSSRNVIRALRAEQMGNVEKRIRPILVLWKKLAGKTSIPQTFESLASTQAHTPWQTFVLFELQIAGELFAVIHSTLIQVHSTIKDSKTQSEQDNHIITALSENHVPLQWSKIWTGPGTAVEFIKAFVHKGLEAERRFLADFNLDFAESINLKEVFNAHTLIACLKLANANKTQKSTKNLSLLSGFSRVEGEVVLQVDSLKIDGASFDTSNSLVIESKSGHSSYDKSPKFFLTFAEQNHDHRSQYKSGYSKIPLYSSNSREALICELAVPTLESDESIVLSGAALVMNEF